MVSKDREQRNSFDKRARFSLNHWNRVPQYSWHTFLLFLWNMTVVVSIFLWNFCVLTTALYDQEKYQYHAMFKSFELQYLFAIRRLWNVGFKTSILQRMYEPISAFAYKIFCSFWKRNTRVILHPKAKAFITKFQKRKALTVLAVDSISDKQG